MYISSFLWRMRTCASLIRGNARIDTAVRRFTINTLICCSLKPYPYFLWSRTGIHHPMYLTGRVQFSSLIFEGKFLIFQGWKSSIVWYNFTLSLSPSLSLSLRESLLNSENYGDRWAMRWKIRFLSLCVYKRVFEIYFFFFSIKFWLSLNGLNECFNF